MSSWRPTMMPACGPPRSLSPLKQQTSTPAATLVVTAGSPDRSGVIGGARLIRRADLAQHGARLSHHIRHAEPAADLDELAARHDHLAAGRKRRENQERCRGVVVHDDGGVRAAQPPKQLLG